MAYGRRTPVFSGAHLYRASAGKPLFGQISAAALPSFGDQEACHLFQLRHELTVPRALEGDPLRRHVAID